MFPRVFTLLFCSCCESLTTTYTSAPPHSGPICSSRHLGLANPMCCGLECAVYSWQRSCKIAVISHYSNSVIYLTLHIHRFPICQGIQMMNRIICVPLSLSTPPAVTAQKTQHKSHRERGVWHLNNQLWPTISQSGQTTRLVPQFHPTLLLSTKTEGGRAAWGSGQPNWVTRNEVTGSLMAITVIIVGTVNCFLLGLMMWRANAV